MIRQQVNEAYLRYKEALNRISVAQTNIQQATENSRIVNNTYFNQLSNLIGLEFRFLIWIGMYRPSFS